MAEGENIVPINIEDEMKSAYIDYSMSVIVSRALPDVRDGFKPVHRRVLYGMLDLGVLSNRPHKKSARIVGEVLGKYHPHGDSSVYETMVRMAQDWSLRYPLVDGQGNFGSIDGDSPAAMRYTEARMQKIAEEMVEDLDKNTVDFTDNFDDTLKEPSVLPARIPNLLVNGASGIAVGMATNMAPHNLREVCNALIAYIDKPDIDVNGLMEHVKAPDFPTGGIIHGVSGVRSAFETGKGRIVLRGKAEIEEVKSGRERIIVTEIPFMVNKADMIKKTADLVNNKKIEGISDIRDESDRTGMRIVYELKRDAISNIVLNNLFKYTPLQSSFSVNNVALVKGRPRSLNLRDLVLNYVEHRHEVLIRKTQYELDQALKRQHILEGLMIALDNLDAVIALIRASKNPEEARNGLMEKFELSEIQAKAILEMRLQKLTGLERDKIKAEYKEISEKIDYYRDVLATESLRMEILKDEINEVSEKYGDDRRTEITHSAEDISIEDMIADEPVVITISHLGYIKRTPLADYRTQGRGGKGSKGSSTREEDFVEHLFVATNHNYILLFTELGRCYWLRVYNIPEGNKTAKGRAIQNLVQIPKDDNIKAFINVKDLKDEEYLENNFIVMGTKKGVIKKTSLQAYSRVRVSGINAISVREGDQLLEVKLTSGNDEILLANKSGRAIRFNESTVRPMGRTASGVRGITLQGDDDEVVGMVTSKSDGDETILVVSENGYGKRSDLDDYRVTNRGGKGVKTINITDKTGSLIAIKAVKETDDLMIINKSGITIRMAVSDMRVMGRATQGVRVITLNEGDQIGAVTKIEDYNEQEENDVIVDSISQDMNSNGLAKDEEAGDAPETDSDDEGSEEE